jgi:predicted Zn-dependent protease
MRTFTSVLVILLSIVVAMPRVQAQASHTASQSAIDAALQEQVSSAAADRADVQRVLANPEVKAVADAAGIDLRRASTAVASLEGEQLSQIAAQARQVDQALAGGQSKIVISTTMIIIALLVLILLIVALD